MAKIETDAEGMLKRVILDDKDWFNIVLPNGMELHCENDGKWILIGCPKHVDVIVHTAVAAVEIREQ